MAPSLFCLSALVVLAFDTMPWSSPHVRIKHWVGKEIITFSDMISSVRRFLWTEWIFAQVPGGAAVQQLSKPLHALIDFALIQVA